MQVIDKSTKQQIEGSSALERILPDFSFPRRPLGPSGLRAPWEPSQVRLPSAIRVPRGEHPFKSSNITTLAVALLAFTLISGFILASNHTSATGTASNTMSRRASVTVAASCSMTADPDGTDTDHTAILPNGVYSGSSSYYPNGIGETTIATFCNDPSGYSIYAMGWTGESAGVTAGTNTVLHNADLGNSYNIATNVYTPSNTASSWSMKVNKVTDSSTSYLPTNLTIENSFDSYHAVPSSYTEVARFSSATDATLGSKIKTTYDAYISGNQPAGTYTGQVKYTLVHPGGSDIPTVDTMQNVDQWGGRVAVGETVTATDSRDNNTYKVTRICTTYSGNNCTASELWMTENLDLLLSPDAPLTSDNTDLNEYGTGAFTPTYGYTCSNSASDCAGGTITWTPSSITLATPATISDFSYSSIATDVVTGWANSYYYPYQAEGRVNGLETNEVYIKNGTIYTTLSACTDDNTPDQCAHYHIGNYYNWPAAVATNDTTSYTTNYTVMPNSICPAGWRLPNGLTKTGNTVNMSDFNSILLANGVTGDGGKDASGTATTDGIDLYGGTNVKYSATGLSKMESDPFYFVRSGLVSLTTLYYSTINGGYWSNAVHSQYFSYYLYYSSSELYPASHFNRFRGLSIRCLAR